MSSVDIRVASFGDGLARKLMDTTDIAAFAGSRNMDVEADSWRYRVRGLAVGMVDVSGARS
jgi:hypothetical protein